jgi:hypothetical protein
MYLIVLLALFPAIAAACRCFKPLDEPLFSHVKSSLPSTYLKAEDLPDRWDWRNVNGTNYCSKVLTQVSYLSGHVPSDLVLICNFPRILAKSSSLRFLLG